MEKCHRDAATARVIWCRETEREGITVEEDRAHGDESQLPYYTRYVHDDDDDDDGDGNNDDNSNHYHGHDHYQYDHDTNGSSDDDDIDHDFDVDQISSKFAQR